ncbi:MAG: hypothetical protein HC892_15285 [Saprospiraceae bacterium]|nr:hypothetical protein [Saprospiraceae bacterium]
MTRRFLVILTSSTLIVTAIVSFFAAIFFFRGVVFDLYKVEFLAQMANTIFLPLLTFCIAVLGIILITREDVSRKKR